MPQQTPFARPTKGLAAEGEILRLFDFSGGLNVAAANSQLKPNESPDLGNVSFSETGALKRRGGRTKWNTTSLPAAPTGLYPFYTSTGARRLLAGVTGTLYELNADGTTTSLIVFGGGAASYWDFETWKGQVFILTPNYGLYQWNGTGTPALVVGSPPTAKFIRHHVDRLWLAKDSSLFFSELLDESTWKDANLITNEIRVGHTDGEEITGMMPQFGSLVVFKTSSIYSLEGFDPTPEGDIFLRCTVPDLGCVAPRSISVIDNRIYFLSHRGVYRINGDGTELLSEPVQPILDALSGANLAACVGGEWGLQYWLALPDASNTVLVYDILRDAWIKHTGMPAGVFATLDGPGDKGELLAASRTAGQVWKLNDSATDDGTAFEAWWKSKRFGEETPEIEKELRYLVADMENVPVGQTVTLNWTAYNRSTTRTGSFSLAGASRKSLPTLAAGHSLQLEFRHTGAADTLKITGLTAATRMKRRAFV